MKKITSVSILIIILSIFGYHPLHAQNPVDTLWTKTIDNGDDAELGKGICQTSDGKFVSVGPTGNQIMVVKTDVDGSTIWIKEYLVGSIGSMPNAIKKTSDGGYVVTGQMMTSGVSRDMYDCFLLRLDSKGDLLWSHTYNNDMDDDGQSVLQTPDGGFVIVGYTIPNFRSEVEAFVIKTDSMGNKIWMKTFGGNVPIYAHAVEQADNGQVIVGEIYAEGEEFSDVYILMLDDSGDTVWTTTFGNQYNDAAYSIKATSDGCFVIGGESRLANTLTGDAYIAKIDANGNVIWTNTYGGVHDDEICSSIVQTPDGGYMGVGYRRIDPSMVTQAWLLRFNDIGDTIWTQYYGPASWTTGHSIINTLDNGYVFIGTASNGSASGNWDFYLVRLDTETVGMPERASTDKIVLNQNFPNPFRYSTNINFQIPSNDKAKVVITDLSGNFIKSLLTEPDEKGECNLVFDASDLNSGIYFYTVETELQHVTKMMVIEK